MNTFKQTITETVSQNCERHFYLLDADNSTFYLYESGARHECIGKVTLTFSQDTGMSKCIIRCSSDDAKLKVIITPVDYGRPVAKVRSWLEALGTSPTEAVTLEDMLS